MRADMDGESAAVRWVICAAVLLALTPRAFAGDFDSLRGSESVGAATFPRWSGFYFGGHVGYSDGSADFSRATEPLVGYSLRELVLEEDQHPSSWPVLGNGDKSATGFGGFVGYNTQWQDLILGLEANYTHAPFTVVASNNPIGRVVSAGSDLYSVNLSGSGSMDVTDYGSLRVRAGWVFDRYLPYGFAGLALGRASYSVSTLVYGQQSSADPPTIPTPLIPCDPADVTTCVDYSYSNSTGKTNTILYGFAVGGGIDVALTPNIFLRGEYEYMQFAPVASITAAISSVRVGAGLKF
jgi:outer membrane immunogenic protein